MIATGTLPNVSNVPNVSIVLFVPNVARWCKGDNRKGRKKGGKEGFSDMTTRCHSDMFQSRQSAYLMNSTRVSWLAALLNVSIVSFVPNVQGVKERGKRRIFWHDDQMSFRHVPKSRWGNGGAVLYDGAKRRQRKGKKKGFAPFCPIIENVLPQLSNRNPSKCFKCSKCFNRFICSKCGMMGQKGKKKWTHVNV